ASPKAGDAARVSQQLATAQAELARSRTENEQLKPAALAAEEMPAVRERAAAAEKSLADTAKQRDTLAGEKSALQTRLADAGARPAIDPQQMPQMRAQLGEALDELA